MQFPPTVDPGPTGPAGSALLVAVLCELVLVGCELYVGVAEEALAPAAEFGTPAAELGALVLDGGMALTGGALGDCATAGWFTGEGGRRRTWGLAPW